MTLSSGEIIGSRTIVWSAESVRLTLYRPTTTTAPAASFEARSHRLTVDGHLRLRPRAYAIGDAASVAPGPGQDGELAMLSPPAVQQGRYVGRMIRVGEPAVDQQPPFRYRDKGTMATIGRRAAAAQMGPLQLRGLLGWITWLVVHLYYLIGFRNRLAVLGSWCWDYLRRDRPIRLIVRSCSDYDPVMASLMSNR